VTQKRISLKSFRVSLVIFCVAFFGCGQKSPYASKEDVRASKNIASSFEAIEIEHLDLALKSDNFNISIHKDALDKEFLLRANLVELLPIPTFEGLKTRIVSFKQIGDSLFLLESTKGHTISNDIPQKLVLTEFAIIAEEDGFITFDFNSGLETLFVESDWRASDASGRFYQEEFEAVDVDYSFIDKAVLNKKKEEFFIQQIAQINREGRSKAFEVRYFFSPYNPDPTFKPAVSKSFDKVGYFEVAPFNKLDGTTIVHASKFHEKDPIIFAISSNTPKEYRQAIKEGVLYWNKTLGKDLIKVIVAPRGVTAPHPDYNIIQWVNWDLAGFAYADAQMDPRTGQILHAHVFLTSSFAFGSIEDARRILDSFKEKKKKRFSLKGFQKEKMCAYNLNKRLKRDLERLLETTPSKEQLLRVSRDYVAELVAHEVGHTLGLRHNFAGSLGQNFPLKQRKEVRKNYFKKGEVPEHLRTTTSVMDYQMFLEGSLTGHFVRKGKSPLEYDKVAMQKLYFNKKLPKNAPLFCTDSHRDTFRYHDCDVFDMGNNFVQFVDWWLKDTLETTPNSMIRAFVRAKVGGLGREPRPIKEVVLSPKNRAEAALDLHYSLVRAFTQEGRFLRIHRLFPAIGELEEEEVREQELDFLADQWSTEDLFPSFGKSFVEKELVRFEETLEKMSSGVGPLGRSYQFSDEELDHIKKKALRFYVLFEKELQKKKLSILRGELSLFEKFLASQGERLKKGIFEDHSVVEKLVPVMEKAVKEVLFAESDEVISTNLTMKIKEGTKKVKKVFSVNLPLFIYDHGLRSKAASLIGSLKSKDYIFGHFEKIGLKKLFEERMKEILNGQGLDKVELGDLSKNAYRWVLKNKKILSTLSK